MRRTRSCGARKDSGKGDKPEIESGAYGPLLRGMEKGKMKKIAVGLTGIALAIGAHAGLVTVDGNEHWGIASDGALVMCDGSNNAWTVSITSNMVHTEAHRDSSGKVMKCLLAEATQQRIKETTNSIQAVASKGDSNFRR